MTACYSAIKKFNVSHELTSIITPTCIIHGTESFLPLNQAKYMMNRIPNASLVIIEGAGHATPREVPKKVNEILEQFLLKKYKS